MNQAVATAALTAFSASASLAPLLPVPEPQPLPIVTPPPQEIALEAPLAPLQATETAPEPIVEEDHDVQAMKDLVAFYAAKHGVNAGVMEFTVSCETGGTFDPKIQSFARYKEDRPDWGVKAGDQEQSYGLAQIHLADPAQRHITIEQATDPDFALEFMGSYMAKGEYWRWSCLTMKPS